MATLQEIIAKRQAMGPNATNVDARNALTPTPSATPAPVTPAPTPIAPTVNVADQMAGKSVAERQAIRNGQPIVPTTISEQSKPVNVVTPEMDAQLKGPLTTQDQSTIDRMTAEGRFGNIPGSEPNVLKQQNDNIPKSLPKVEPVIDYTQAQGRENEIMTNLEKFKTQGMTPEQIKTASGYNEASPEKKAIIDGSLNPVKQDAGTIFSTLRAGGSVPASDTPEYRQAQARYNTFKRFSTYDVASLSTAMQGGDLLMGTQAYNDVISDPSMLAKIQKAKIFMNGEVDLVKIGEKQGQYVMTQNPTVAKALEDGYITAEEYNSMTSTPEVEAQARVVSEAKTKYDEYKRQLEQISDDVDAEYKDKETTDSFRSAIKANRDKAVRRLYNSASDDLQNASGLYTELKNSSTQRLELNMKQYEAQQAEENQIAKEERAIQAQKDALQYEADFNKKQSELALSDPATQIGATIKQFADLGIIADKNTAWHVAEQKRLGMSLNDYTKKMIEDFKTKPEYKKIQELQAGQMSDAQKLKATQSFQTQSDIRNFAQQKELALLNKDLTRQQFLFELENDPEKKAKALELEQKLNSNKSLFDVLGKNVGTYEGNRGYDLAGNLGDPLPAGGNWTVKSIDTAGEQVGSIFIGGKGKKPYGNTVVMQDENGNEIRYSHLQDIGVKPGDILGFGDIVGTRGNTGNVKGANGETLTAEQLKAGRGAHVDIEIKSNGKLLSNADQVNFLKGLKAGGDQALTDKQFTQYNQTKTGFKSEPIVKSFEEALIAGGDIIQSLGSENGPGDIGAVFNFMKSLDPNSTVREGEFALAAKSAGVWESFKNIPANKLEGTILTDKQRKDFGKLAMKYIESKGKLYDTKYNDMIKVLENQGVPKSYYPTKMTDYINQYKGTQETTSNTSPAYTTDQYNILNSFWTQN